MKLEIFLNNHFPKYNRTPMEINDVVNVPLKYIKRAIKSGEHTYILRGEPTLHPYLYEILDALQGKNFILTTSGYNPEILIRYPKKIPYLVIGYDGFLNDKLRNTDGLSRNMMRLLDHFGKREETTTRIQYTISKMNLEWLKADSEILIKLYAQHPNLKKPYFVIYQQTEIYNQEVFTWVGLGKDMVSMLNKKGLLSEKNLAYMNAWMDKKTYKCLSPANTMVMAWDGTFRTCLSMRFGEQIGEIDGYTLEEIIEDSKDVRSDCSECSYRTQCWLSFNFKDNIALNKDLGSDFRYF